MSTTSIIKSSPEDTLSDIDSNIITTMEESKKVVIENESMSTAAKVASSDGESILSSTHDTNVDIQSNISSNVANLSKRSRDDTDDDNDEFVSSSKAIVEVPNQKKSKQRNDTDGDEVDTKISKMSAACKVILECIGEDPSREGLIKTPERWAKALLFMNSGYQLTAEDVTNDALFTENHHEMVVVRNIDIHSLCEHHMLPFTGQVHIGYIPNGKIIGLSKLARIADLYARRLQVQERLTSQIADAIVETVQPLGVAVVIECSHFCMILRGVQKNGAITTTSSVRGCFETNSKTRAEFFSILERRR